MPLQPDTILCPKCGANFALVGRSHRCVANPIYDAANLANKPDEVANADKKLRDDASCYMRYRDPAARRAYMKAYMAKRRRVNAGLA
jgi:hypothetical protein